MSNQVLRSDSESTEDAGKAGATAAGVARAALLRQIRNLGRRLWRNPNRMFAPSVPPLKIIKERARKGAESTETQKPGLRTILRELWAKGAVHAIKSVVPAFAANAITGVILFNSFSEIMKHFSDLHHKDLVREHHHALHHTAVAGAAAGFLQSFIAAPIDTLTIRTETDPHMRDWIHQAQQHTALSLWRGFHLTLMRDTLGFSLFFTSYEAMKQTIRDPYLRNEAEIQQFAKDNASLSPQAVKAIVRVFWTLSGGMIAGSLQQIVDTPLRTIRYALEATKENSNEYLYKDARHYIRTLLQEHTWGAIVRQTFGAGLFRAMPPAAIAFALFETTLGWDD